LIEGELQRAEAVRLEMLADELILALRLVHRHAPARDHAQAVGRPESQVLQRRSKNDRSNLRRAVLEREIQMSGIPDAAVRQFTLDPDLEELLLEQIADPDRQLGDGEDAPRRRALHVTSAGRWPGLDRLLGLLVLFKRKIEQVGHR